MVLGTDWSSGASPWSSIATSTHWMVSDGTERDPQKATAYTRASAEGQAEVATSRKRSMSHCSIRGRVGGRHAGRGQLHFPGDLVTCLLPDCRVCLNRLPTISPTMKLHETHCEKDALKPKDSTILHPSHPNKTALRCFINARASF